jgi:hypothetical protein
MVGKKGHIDYSGKSEDARVSRFNELYRLGKTDREIELATGSTHMMVYNWRKRFGLKKNERMQPVTSNHVSDKDLNYIAGFLDGEGCVSIRKLNMKRRDGSPRFIFAPIIEFSNTNLEVLKFIREKLGLTVNVNIHESGCRGNRKMTYKFAIKGWRNCLHVAKMLIPYSMVKRNQLYILIKFCEGRTGKFFMNTPYDDVDWDYYNTIFKLNSHGRENDTPKIDIEGRFLTKRTVETEGNPKSGETIIESMSEADASYLAGFLDGEGYVGFCRNSNGNFLSRIQFTNTDIEIIENIKKITGTNNKILTVDTGNPKEKIAYRITITSFQETLSLAEKLYSYSIVKKERLGLLMKFIEYKMNKISSLKNVEQMDEIALCEKMKVLNHRGL